MVEDRLLIWKFKHGSQEALRAIYEKYRCYLLALATALSNDVNTAEDVVHDFFVSFAQSSGKLKLDGSLKWYLATCVANRTRDKIRARQRQAVRLDETSSICLNANGPESSVICNEELKQLRFAIGQLPYEQREVVILHAKGEMKFRQIARLQNVSIKTVQSRYRYGLDKLRLILEGKVEK
jgi:RNA polymerase sigma-70 factor (ECF subfamily)